MFPPDLRSRLRSSATHFVRDEAGSATIWSLTWLLGFAIMAGLAIDSTNGWRNKTMLQSTADISALAGAIEIPSPLREIPYDPTPGAYDATVRAKALEYADKNQSMDQDAYGEYLVEQDIAIGNWDRDTRSFTPGDEFATPDELPVNAVRVGLLRDEAVRGNGVPTSVLHVIGFRDWEIATEAIAFKGHYECWRQGFMSYQKVCQRTGSDWYPGFCLYGQEGIFLRPDNTWGEGAEAFLPDEAHDGIDPSNKPPQADPGLVVMRDEMPVPFIDSVPAIAQSVLSGSTYYTHPDFSPTSLEVLELGTSDISSNRPEDEPEEAELAAGDSDNTGDSGNNGRGGGRGGGGDGGAGGCQGGSFGGSQVAPLPNGYEPLDLVARENLPDDSTPWTDSELERHRIYYHDGNGRIRIDGDVRDVVIVSRGGFDIQNGSSLENVTLVSLEDAANGPDSIDMNHTRLGNVDACEPGGEVMVYTMGSIGGPSGAEFYGATLVSGGSIGFAANADAMYGIAAFAAGNVSFTSGNTFGGIGGNGVTGSDACVEGTHVPIPDDEMRVSLVR